MKLETYNWLWERIEQNIISIEDALDPAEKERMHFRRVYGKRTKNVIFHTYNDIRDEFKAQYYKRNKSHGIEQNLIDHHKIAACFCKAFIKKKIFTFDLDDTISAEMLLSNYKLAYSVSLTIIYLCMIEWYLYKKDKAILDTLLSQKQLLGPQTTPTQAPYHEGRIKSLAQNDYFNVEFDILSYASIMYWIEYYNRQLLENRVNIEYYDPDRLTD